MTQKDFNREFIQDIANDLSAFTKHGFLDRGAVRETYAILTDRMERNGSISEKQRFNWCTPKGALNLSYLKSKAK